MPRPCRSPLQRLLPAAALWAGSAAPQAAVLVAECRGPEGEVLFAEQCPPGHEKIGEHRLPGEGRERLPALSEAPPPPPAVLYTTEPCESCDILRMALQRRAVPFEEKSAAQDPAVQNELRALTGALAVPALKVGDRVLTGYNRLALEQALQRAGFAPAGDGAAAP